MCIKLPPWILLPIVIGLDRPGYSDSSCGYDKYDPNDLGDVEILSGLKDVLDAMHRTGLAVLDRCRLNGLLYTLFCA